MKTSILTFFILILALSGICAQGNRPSATIITDQENQALAVPAEAEQRFVTPRLFWEGASRTRIPQQVTAGDRVTLVLRAAGWNAQSPVPAFFLPEVPQNVILAVLPVTTNERFNGIVIKLTLIPLKEGLFILPARLLQYENTRFEIPELNIQVVNRN